MNKKSSAALGFGMSLSLQERKELYKAGISSFPAVSKTFQKDHKRSVLRAEESGGAIQRVGHYTGFQGIGSDGIFTTYKRSPLLHNNVHALVLGKSFARFEVLRFKSSCNLLVTLHSLIENKHVRTNITHLTFGEIDTTTLTPTFISISGDALTLPDVWLPGIRAAIRGASCNYCGHIHFDGLPPLPEDILALVHADPLLLALPKSNFYSSGR